MKLSDTMTATEQQHALTDLLESDGWKLYLEQVEQHTGAEAFVRAVDKALETIDPDHERAMTSRLREAYKLARDIILWPEERVRALKDGTAAAKSKVAESGLFGAFKRARQA